MASGLSLRAGPKPVPTASSRPPIRFSEVLAELRWISELLADDPGRAREACRRAEALLAALRAQFLGDVVGDMAR